MPNDNDPINKALEAMSNATTAIRNTTGVTDVSMDNDNDSGEIIFAVAGQKFILRLEEFDDDDSDIS